MKTTCPSCACFFEIEHGIADWQKHAILEYDEQLDKLKWSGHIIKKRNLLNERALMLGFSVSQAYRIIAEYKSRKSPIDKLEETHCAERIK